MSTVKKDWDLRKVLPGKPVIWKAKVTKSSVYRLRVPNPMKGGKPLRFANKEQGAQWLRIEMQ